MTLGQPSSNNQILEWYLRMTSPGKRQWGTSNAASSFAKGEFFASFEKVGKKWIIQSNLRKDWICRYLRLADDITLKKL